jgi:hypothetical protein
MLQAPPPVAAAMANAPTPFAVRAMPRARSAAPRPLPVLRWVVEETCLPEERAPGVPLLGGGRAVGKSLRATASVVRRWVSPAGSYARHARGLWGDAGPAKVQAALADLLGHLQSQGLEGLAQALMPWDALEKQVLLHHLAQAIEPSHPRRRQVLEFARSVAAAERPTLSFLENTVDVFGGFDHALPNGAAMLRQAVHELGTDAAPSGEIKPAAVAQVLLRKFGAVHFDAAVQLLRSGIRADLRSRRISPLGPRLLAAATDRSVFCAVKLAYRVANALGLRLAQLGVQGHCAATDLACALLAGADSGSGQPSYLLSRYLGPETAASIRANRQAVECFKAAFAALPITLWPPSRAHRRDLLLANLGQAHAR